MSLCFHQGDRPSQRRRLEDDVGIGKEQEIAGRRGRAELQRVVLAEPAVGQLR